MEDETPQSTDGKSAYESLTTKQQQFVLHYLTDAKFNGAKAARLAGYSEDSAYSIATENLRKPAIKAAIAELLPTHGLTPERIKIALLEIAFDEDVADFEKYLAGEENLEQLRERGLNTSLVHQVKLNPKTGERTLRTYSRIDALKELARVIGMVTEKHQHSGSIGGLDPSNLSDEELTRRAHAAGVDDGFLNETDSE